MLRTLSARLVSYVSAYVSYSSIFSLSLTAKSVFRGQISRDAPWTCLHGSTTITDLITTPPVPTALKQTYPVRFSPSHHDDSFGVAFWLTERSSRKYPGDTLGIVAAHLLTIAVLAIVWCAQAEQFPVSFESFRETVLPSSGSLAVPSALLWTGLVTTSLTVFAETLAMKRVSAAESTVIFSTEPIWATAFAVVLLGETIGWNTGLGATLIVLACSWSSVGGAIQNKLSSLVAAWGVAGTSVWTTGVDGNDLMETVWTSSHEEVRRSLDIV